MVASPDTLAQLGWDSIIEDLASRCRTETGAALVRALGWMPSVDAARERMAEIAEARGLVQSGRGLSFGGVSDLGSAVARAEKGASLEPEELVAVAECARGCDRLRRHLVEHRERAERLFAHARHIEDLGHMFHPILESFEEGCRLADHASAELGPLRKAAMRARADLDRRARSLLDELGDALQDHYYTERDDRCVVPIRVEARSSVRGIVHGTSQSGQTVFIEPEALVEIGNRLVLADAAVADEERRILAQLSGYVREEAAPLTRGLEVASTLDLIAACAAQAEATSAAEPNIVDARGAIRLSEARHVGMELGGRSCVPNDIAIGHGAVLVVSGPNAGGKTVALKTTGLAVLMVRAGLHIAAHPQSEVPWLERIESDIGDAQNLDKDLSTFSGHLLRVEQILAAASDSTLILFDELAVGTEPEQGAALAQAVLERLADKGAHVLVTTHYERLKALAAGDPRFVNASVGFDLDRMTPTFELHLGVPGSSGALRLARRLALDGQVVARAEALLGISRTGVEELLGALAAERTRVAEERDELRLAKASAERARAEAETAKRNLVAREQKVREASHDQAVAALREARRELDELKVQVRRRKRKDGGGGEGTLDLAQGVERAAAQISAHAPRAKAEDHGLPPDPLLLVPGVAVKVLSLGGAAGQVVAPPSGQRVAVQVGPLKTTAKVADVRILHGDARRALTKQSQGNARAHRQRGDAPTHELVAAPSDGRAYARTRDATLDLRGERVDDALSALDRFLDESLRAEREVIFVIHGHGTGALRNAIREHVAIHPQVTSFRPGEQSEGGDGITVAWITG